MKTPEELAGLMRWDFAPSPEQWEAIHAPLEPAVVIAGAGSGKTTMMAARVVYLAATEQVLPDEGGLCGGAELVHLGLPDGDAAVVQQQPAYDDDGDERTTLRAQMERASSLVRAETFPAVAGDHCRDCDFKPICPIQGAGSVTQR